MLWKYVLQGWNLFLYSLDIKLYTENILENLNLPMFMFHESTFLLPLRLYQLIWSILSICARWYVKVHSFMWVHLPSTLFETNCSVIHILFTLVRNRLWYYLWSLSPDFPFGIIAMCLLFHLHHCLWSCRESIEFLITAGGISCWFYVTGVSVFTYMSIFFFRCWYDVWKESPF